MNYERYKQILVVKADHCETIDISRYGNLQKKGFFSFLIKQGWIVHLISPDFDIEAYFSKYAKNGVIDAKLALHTLKYIDITL